MTAAEEQVRRDLPAERQHLAEAGMQRTCDVPDTLSHGSRASGPHRMSGGL
ncbi:hypothetical protein [Kitasatospora sp. NPDC059571]|uniref:hypothetical protein n=1 Tax=Kitasatospora sp. NPDC059571 TaxID=3346871 RepID=UPI0036B44B9A